MFYTSERDFVNDLVRTQHFTTAYKEILQNITFTPLEAIDPFAGNCDLKAFAPKADWKFYDIEPKNSSVEKRDSLLNPIDYTDKTVITNPPYLAKNKTKEFKEIFEKYQVDDLYKAAIKSIIGCKNGILIIPLNFFLDERSAEIRKLFLSRYKVSYVNYFTYQVFENTTYNVCSFYFEKGKTDNVIFYNVKEKKKIFIKLEQKFDYRIGGEFFNAFKNTKPIFKRLIGNEMPNCNIFLSCLDKRNEHFGLSYKEVYYGKESDRMFATLKSIGFTLSEEQQKELIKLFNQTVENARKNYGDLIFTNYRDFGRKRISFNDALKLISLITLKHFF